jgi:DNA-3-methyladenine glycosylase
VPRASRLDREFFARRADDLAPDLLGHVLVRVMPDGRILAGRIIEVEAYIAPEDQASHAKNLHRSPRNEAMYGPPGLSYVYFTYGMHHCMNVVCAAEGVPHAVLIRAIEPLEGLDRMRSLRGGAAPDRDLCRGPGRLCQAMGLDRTLSSVDLTIDPRLGLERGEHFPARVARTARIGVDSAGPRWARRRLRFVWAGHPLVSGPRA